MKTESNRAKETELNQHSVCSKTYPTLSPIAPLLPGTAGTPSWPLLREAGHHGTPSCHTTYRYNLAIPSVQNLSRNTSTNISPIPGSLHPVLTYPDAEIAPKI